MFIEVKKTTEKLDRHQKQLLEYSFSEGIELSVLTNGIDWWFYLPTHPTPWEDRIYCQVDVTKDKITDVVENFIRYLSKERVTTNESLRLAREIHENKSRIQTVEDTIPRVWNSIITELLENKEDSLLYDLISDEVKNQSSITPQPQSIIDFIQSNRDRFSVNEKQIKKPKKETKDKHPKLPPMSFTDDYYGKKVKSFTFDGKKQDVNLWKDVLVGLCERIYEKHSQDFERIFEIRGRKRQYFVRNTKDVRDSRPISNSGICVETNFSSKDIVKRCGEVLVKFGYSVNDIELEFQTKEDTRDKTKPTSSQDDTSSSVIEKIGKEFQCDLVRVEVKGGRGKYYQTSDKSKYMVILTSKRYDDGDRGYGYWYGLRQNQIKFLSNNSPSYLVLVCGDVKTIFIQKWSEFESNLKTMNTSGEGDKTYYHIKIFDRKTKMLLGLPDIGNPKDVSKFII